MQKIFFRIERFPSERSSLFGIFTVPVQGRVDRIEGRGRGGGHRGGGHRGGGDWDGERGRGRRAGNCPGVRSGEGRGKWGGLGWRRQ